MHINQVLKPGKLNIEYQLNMEINLFTLKKKISAIGLITLCKSKYGNNMVLKPF